MSFVSDIVGGVLGANAAGKAANAEQQGAQQAQSTIQQNQTASNQFQNNVLNNTTAAEQPYQQVGSTAANNLVNILNKGFTAPTLQDAQSTPGYQFQLQQGTNAINQNAAANGTLLTGNTGVALQNYGQNLASTAYQQTYNNALNTYQANLAANQSGVNTGLNSTSQLGSFGQEAANNTANINTNAANGIANQQNNAAAARASGYLGTANAIGSAVGGAATGLEEFAGL